MKYYRLINHVNAIQRAYERECGTRDVGLGSLGVTCSPRDPKFASSNPAEVDGFFQDVKILGGRGL